MAVDSFSGDPSDTPEGSYEFQQEILRRKLDEISARLFESGVAPRLIVQAAHPTGAYEPIDEFDLLGYRFGPAFLRLATRVKNEDFLTLAVAKREGRSIMGFKLGRVDSSGVIVHPLKGINRDDADAVLAEALDLLALQRDGVLPNLRYNLLSILKPGPENQKSSEV